MILASFKILLGPIDTYISKSVALTVKIVQLDILFHCLTLIKDVKDAYEYELSFQFHSRQENKTYVREEHKRKRKLS